jgi:hypothetical protein
MFNFNITVYEVVKNENFAKSNGFLLTVIKGYIFNKVVIIF